MILRCAEMYLDRQCFRPVADLSVMQLGDLVWFGLEDPPAEPEEFERGVAVGSGSPEPAPATGPTRSAGSPGPEWLAPPSLSTCLRSRWGLATHQDQKRLWTVQGSTWAGR